MNSSTYKEDAMQYVRSVAVGKAERMRKTMEMHKEVKSTMRTFHSKQMMLKQDIMAEINDRSHARTQANLDRITESQLLTKQLEKEGNQRRKGIMKLSQGVHHMLSGFDHMQHQLRQEIERDCKDLHTMLKDQEQQRLNEFKAFEQTLAQERKGLNDLTNSRSIATQRFLNQCKKTQLKMAAEMQAQFSENQKIRAEIQKAWAAISLGDLPAMAKANPEKLEIDSQSQGEASEALDSLTMKLKAVISGFHEGCKISELHRALGDVSKASVREAIDNLLSAKEIRRDDNHKFHLI